MYSKSFSKFFILVLVLVLSAALISGCARTYDKPYTGYDSGTGWRDYFNTINTNDYNITWPSLGTTGSDEIVRLVKGIPGVQDAKVLHHGSEVYIAIQMYTNNRDAAPFVNDNRMNEITNYDPLYDYNTNGNTGTNNNTNNMMNNATNNTRNNNLNNYNTNNNSLNNNTNYNDSYSNYGANYGTDYNDSVTRNDNDYNHSVLTQDIKDILNSFGIPKENIYVSYDTEAFTFLNDHVNNVNNNNVNYNVTTFGDSVRRWFNNAYVDIKTGMDNIVR